MFRAFGLLALYALVVAGAHAQGNSPTLKRISDTRVISLGHRTDSVPFSFVRNDRQPAGYSVDLCKRVVARLQQQLKRPALRIKWVPVTAESRIAAGVKGEIDLECGTTTATLTRYETVGFSNLILVDGGGILLRSDDPAQRLADFAGKRIAVTAGTTAEKRLPEVLPVLSPRGELGVGPRLRIRVEQAPDYRTGNQVRGSENVN